MYNIKNYEEIENYPADETVLFVDVRSPSEYRREHIPGSINMPVLDDDARRKVGTLYDEGRADESKLVGVRHVSKKLPEYFERLCRYTREYDHLILYCSRGGYRSTVLTGLLQSLDIPVERLNMGYKGYRKFIREHLPGLIREKNYVILDGMTGCGKTEILKELEERGASVLDLEALANHRGSLLGGVGLGEQPSQKQFESDMYEVLKHADSVVFTEGESPRIGRIVLPKALTEKMRTGRRVRITDSMDRRIRRIYREYVSHRNTRELKDALESMDKYISKENIKSFEEQLERGDVKSVIETLILSYYDPRYRLSREYSYILENRDSPETAEILLHRCEQRS